MLLLFFLLWSFVYHSFFFLLLQTYIFCLVVPDEFGSDDEDIYVDFDEGPLTPAPIGDRRPREADESEDEDLSDEVCFRK